MIVAVVATRNEAETIGTLISHLREHVDQVIVSDESDDLEATRFNAMRAGGLLIDSSFGGRGLGPSLLRGWREAFRMRPDRVIQIDAGGSHDPDDIPSLVAVDADIVIGSRFVKGSEYVGRPWRSVASRVYGYSMYARSGLPVSDWTSGFRVFKPEPLARLSFMEYAAHMHGFQAEVLLRAHEFGMSVTEVPIRYQAGDSALRLPHMWEAIKVR